MTLILTLCIGLCLASFPCYTVHSTLISAYNIKKTWGGGLGDKAIKALLVWLN